MRRWAPLLLALLAGCGGEANKPSKKTEADRGTLGVSIMTSRNPFFNVLGESFKADAEKAGYKVILVSGDQDAAKQQNQVKDFLVQKVRAIVLCPCDSRAVGPVIREANAAGVPVFTADLGCLDASAKVVTHVATDNLSGGKEAARALIEALGEVGGKVAILDYKEAESCQLRVEGFKEVIKSHNAAQPARKITIVAELPSNGDRENGFKAAQTLLTSHPDLAGIFAINDPAALGAWAALDAAKKTEQVKLIGFDGQPEGKKAIREGKIYADPIQFPDKIGKTTFECVQKHFAGERLPAEILIPTKLYRKSDAINDAEAK
jgi:ribose transport system substrate-binding protein